MASAALAGWRPQMLRLASTRTSTSADDLADLCITGSISRVRDRCLAEVRRIRGDDRRRRPRQRHSRYCTIFNETDRVVAAVAGRWHCGAAARRHLFGWNPRSVFCLVVR